MWLFYRHDVGEGSCWGKGSMADAKAHREQCGSFVGSTRRWSAHYLMRSSILRCCVTAIGSPLSYLHPPEERRSKPLTTKKEDDIT